MTGQALNAQRTHLMSYRGFFFRLAYPEEYTLVGIYLPYQ
jgi:hypothetical protein